MSGILIKRAGSRGVTLKRMWFYLFKNAVEPEQDAADWKVCVQKPCMRMKLRVARSYIYPLIYNFRLDIMAHEMCIIIEKFDCESRAVYFDSAVLLVLS